MVAEMSRRVRCGEDSSVLEKAFCVLDALSLAAGPQSMSQLSIATGIPRSTVHRLIQQMVDLGVLTQGPRGVRLGRALFELGSQVPESRRIREMALPFMTDLYEVTHQTIHLGIREGVDILLVEKIRGHGSLSFAAKVGRRLPLNCTSIGKVLLARENKDVIDNILGRPLRRLTKNSIVDPQALHRQLADVQTTGIAVDHGEAQDGLSCVAAPVLRGARCVAALAISGPSDDLVIARTAPAVRTAALALSRFITNH